LEEAQKNPPPMSRDSSPMTTSRRVLAPVLASPAGVFGGASPGRVALVALCGAAEDPCEEGAARVERVELTLDGCALLDVALGDPVELPVGDPPVVCGEDTVGVEEGELDVVAESLAESVGDWVGAVELVEDVEEVGHGIGYPFR
jgi:hypothetical protein